MNIARYLRTNAYDLVVVYDVENNMVHFLTETNDFPRPVTEESIFQFLKSIIKQANWETWDTIAPDDLGDDFEVLDEIRF